MSSLPKQLGTLSGIVALVAVLLLGLLRGTPPVVVLRKAALCAAVLGGVTWLCSHIALDVMAAGVRANVTEDSD